MRKHKLLIPLFVLALALGLAACGGSSESDEDKVVATIEDSVASNDPANCTELVTLAFNEQTNDGEGAEATKECEEDAEDETDQPDSVEVTNVKVDGSNATADVAFIGGSFDGQTLDIELVEEDGWKMDHIAGFVEFDKGALIEALSTGFEEQESIDPELTSCMVEIFEEAEQEEFEELILGGSSQGFVEIAEACQE